MKEHAEAVRIALEKIEAVVGRWLVSDGINAEQAMTEILAITDDKELLAQKLALLNYAAPNAKLVLDLTGGSLQDLSCTVPVDLLILSHDREDVREAVPLNQIDCLGTFRGDILLDTDDETGVAARLQLDASHGTEQAAVEYFAQLKR